MAANRLQTLALQMNPAKTELLLAGTKEAHVRLVVGLPCPDTPARLTYCDSPAIMFSFPGSTISFRRF